MASSLWSFSFTAYESLFLSFVTVDWSRYATTRRKKGIRVTVGLTLDAAVDLPWLLQVLQ